LSSEILYERQFAIVIRFTWWLMKKFVLKITAAADKIYTAGNVPAQKKTTHIALLPKRLT